MSHIVVGILGTAIIAIYAVSSRRLVATDSQWYRSLVKPAWQPPRVVIGLIWPYNFAMLTTATWVVASHLSNTHHLVWLMSLTLSVLASLAWAWLFFNPLIEAHANPELHTSEKSCQPRPDDYEEKVLIGIGT